MAADGTDEPAYRGWHRWRAVILAAARWVLDVLRGFSWSRHLYRREK